MPRLANRPPKMSLVKSTGDAVVYVNRKRLYLGPWGSDVARERYRQFLEAWIAADGRLPDESPTLVTISRLVVAYLKWAKPRLDRAHFHHSKAVAGFLVNLHGHTPVGKFGPKALATVQKQMEMSGRFSRGYVNKLVNNLRTIFRWAVAQELVHPSQVDRAKRHAENPKSRARDHYDSQSYARSIKYAIIRANKLLPESERIPHWTPYQLCHAALQPRRPENRDRTGEKTRRENERTRSVSRATHRTVGSLTDRIDRRQGDDVDELVGTFSTAQRALDAQVMLLTLDVAFVGDFVLFRRQVGLDAQMLAF